MKEKIKILNFFCLNERVGVFEHFAFMYIVEFVTVRPLGLRHKMVNNTDSVERLG